MRLCAHTVMLGVLGLLVGVLLWRMTAGSQPSQPQAPMPPANLLGVEAASARLERWPRTLQAFGSIVPRDEIIVGAQIEGHALVALQAEVGDRVRQDQVLARFDTRMLAIELQRLRAEVNQAEAELEQAQVERDRAQRLAASGAVSQQEARQRATAAEVAQARLAATQALVAARALDLQRGEVIAPDDGTVVARNAQLGMVASAGLELFRIIRHDRIEWRGELTAQQFPQVQPGQQVVLELADGAQARALVRQVAPAMDPHTRLLLVYADVEPGSAARAGAYVAGRIMLEDTPALTIPAASLVIRDGHTYVFVVAGERRERVIQRQVTVGRQQAAAVEVLDGLGEGDWVVTQGAGFLQDGEQVRLLGDGRHGGPDGETSR